MMQIKPDPKLYREMAVPFPSPEAANEAHEAFFTELGELRKKHKIRDLYCTVAGSAVYEDGEEGDFVTSCFFGNQLAAESLCAWALGHETARARESVTKALARAAKR